MAPSAAKCTTRARDEGGKRDSQLLSVNSEEKKVKRETRAPKTTPKDGIARSNSVSATTKAAKVLPKRSGELWLRFEFLRTRDRP